MKRAFVNAKPVGFEGPLVVEGEAITADATGAKQVDCAGLTLAPGIVDLGVFAVDRAACRAGGITRVGLLPGLVLTVRNATEIVLTPVGAIAEGRRP